MPIPSPIKLAPWACPLIEPRRFKVLYGGRGSGKSWQIAHVLVFMAYHHRLTIHCCREFMKSLEDSSKRIIERATHNMELGSYFSIRSDRIICTLTGSVFTFHGLDRSRESIRGWEGVDICWIDEAQRLSDASFEILLPSVRKSGSEIWFSFNPQYRYQPVWREFVANRRNNAFVRKVNYRDNPFLTPELRSEMQDCKKYNPDRFAHIWLGEPDDEGAARKVLPYEKLRICVEAYEKFDASNLRNHYTIAGLDIADTGTDKNAFAVKNDGVLFYIEAWKSEHLKQTHDRASSLCYENGVHTLYYDMGGVGAGIRSHLIESSRQRSFGAHGVNFGSEVSGKKTIYTQNQTNGDFFMRRNGQLAWALHLRMQNTVRLMNGEDIDPRYCLFIHPKLEIYLAQLSQPEWEENDLGKLVIEKTPENTPSPDAFDAVALAFTLDSRYGLRVRSGRIWSA